MSLCLTSTWSRPVSVEWGWHSFKKVLHLPGNTQRGTVLLEGRENGQLRYAAGEYGVVAAVALVGAGVALLLVGVVMVVTVSVNNCVHVVMVTVAQMKLVVVVKVGMVTMVTTQAVVMVKLAAVMVVMESMSMSVVMVIQTLAVVETAV
ncbi:hypothetical protein J1605_006439 [Eschrichtius robustus]|uniref:Uncharacterized protein n=1 Tax=Eschrichtius robustus TaxID=9764 RepID=A0AB34H3E3_ESCRO|nr:hypothetical protein J1605_006439 [Eschrichtius robustus]